MSRADACPMPVPAGLRAPLPGGAATALRGRRSPALHGEHLRRLDVVLAHIDAHLAADLSLERMAGLAAFSPFHFHRLFLARTGETLKAFVRRRRLEDAGGRLALRPQERVTEVSRACGFASPEAFARAFREHYGMTPSEWRSAASAGPKPAQGSSRATVAPVRAAANASNFSGRNDAAIA